MKHQNKSLWQLLLIIPVIVLIFCTISTASAQTVPEIAEKALAATVYLEMQDSNGETLGFGSGFFVRENLIATNYHVIKGAMHGTAKLVGKSTTYIINRGSIKVLLGRTQEAKQDFQTALRLAEHATDDKVKGLTKNALKLIDQQDLK